MNLEKDIQELLDAKVITADTAEKMQVYYEQKETGSNSRLFLVFGIIGAVLVGLGLILIVAHNWDNFDRTVKTALSFTPLFLGQLACVFALLKKSRETAWREGSATFLFLAIGANIALIGQVYNIPGSLSSYLEIWMLLGLPLIYLMRSSVASYAYLIGITYYIIEVGYWSHNLSTYYYWLLLLGALPHYYYLLKNKRQSNFLAFHNWLIPFSLVVALGTVGRSEDWLLLAYFSLFGVFYILGNLMFSGNGKFVSNGYTAIGSAGMVLLLLFLSFDYSWEDIRKGDLNFSDSLASVEFFTAIIITLIGSALLVYKIKIKGRAKIRPLEPVFLAFAFIFCIGQVSAIAMILVNLVALLIGIATIREGERKDHLGVLNYGLLIISGLVICRFFDINLTFIWRGLLFIGVGVGFFLVNYRTLKRRRADEK